MFSISPLLEIQWRLRRPRNAETLERQGWTFLPLNREWDAIEQDLIMVATELNAVSPSHGMGAPQRWWVAYLAAYCKFRDPIRSAMEVEHLRSAPDARRTAIQAVDPETLTGRRNLDGGGTRLVGAAANDEAGWVGQLDGPSPWIRMQLKEIEGRAVVVIRPGRGGWAWVWSDGQWRWAPGLACKAGVTMSSQDFRREFPDADMADMIRIAASHVSTSDR
jgi:hypothetical protein